MISETARLMRFFEDGQDRPEKSGSYSEVGNADIKDQRREEDEQVREYKVPRHGFE